MTGVFDYQSDVVLASKFDSSKHVISPSDVDGVAGVIAQLTWLG